MIYLLIYDIECDRVRNKVAKTCEEYGLERVQFSAFWGQISSNKAEELLLKCKELIADHPARVHMLPLCAQCFARRTSYSTAHYQGAPDRPRDPSPPLILLPDSDHTHDDHQLPSRQEHRTRKNIAGRPHHKDRPVGTDIDPWEDLPDA